MFGDWILQAHNCTAFVLVIFAVIFMFFAMLAWTHRGTVLFCTLVTFICAGFAWYFLSPQCIIRQSRVPT